MDSSPLLLYLQSLIMLSFKTIHPQTLLLRTIKVSRTYHVFIQVKTLLTLSSNDFTSTQTTEYSKLGVSSGPPWGKRDVVGEYDKTCDGRARQTKTKWVKRNSSGTDRNFRGESRVEEGPEGRTQRGLIKANVGTTSWQSVRERGERVYRGDVRSEGDDLSLEGLLSPVGGTDVGVTGRVIDFVSSVLPF